MFKKNRFSRGSLQLNPDVIFDNTYFEVDFFFEDLIYLHIPGLEKKLYNGRLVLNAARLSFPFKITVKTAGNLHEFNVDKAGAYDFKSGRIELESINTNNLRLVKFQTASEQLSPIRLKQFIAAGASLQFSDAAREQILIKNDKLTIKHSPYKTSENL